MKSLQIWDHMLRKVGELIGDELANYRPNLARSTGVIPGRQLPTTGNTGSGYTPTAHASSHQAGGGDEVDLGLLAGELTDTQHGSRSGGNLHAAATTSTPGFVQLAPNGGTTAGQAVQASDTRMSNARTPTAHASTHQHGGSDEVATATPAANAIPKAGSGGTLADGWLSSAIARLTDLTFANLSGTLSDAQHGSRSGGSLHATATTSAAGFMSSADKTKLDGIGSGAAVTGVSASAPLQSSGGTAPTISLANQSANQVLAGPSSGAAAAPGFRALVTSDLPTHASTHQNGGSDEIATATPGANAIPKAGSGGTLADGWLSSAIARLTDLTWTNISGKPSTFAPSAHATSHQNGGSDEIATATPGANAIPKAGSGGTLADGWLSSAISRITSIALAAPAQFSVSGSPLTANGTLTLAWQNQSANQVLAGPSSGAAAAPGFRALVAADIPSLDSGKIGSGEMPRSPLTTRGDLLTQNPSGTHTRLAIGASGRYLRSDGTDPSWAQLDMADAAAGTLAAARGGTGLASYAVGDLLYASGATALSKLAGVATGNALISGGVAAAPAWGKIGLTTHVSGILPAANGGTGVDNGANTLTIPASGTAALRASAATAGRVGFWSSATDISHDANLTWDGTNQWLVFAPKDNGGGFYVPFKINDSAGSARTVFGLSSSSPPDVLLNMPTSQALRILFNAATEVARFNNTGLLVGKTSGLTGAGDGDFNGNVRAATFRIGLNQVVGVRVTGWGTPSGTLSRATFDQSTVTLAQLAQRLAALITDLLTHGLIGA